MLQIINRDQSFNVRNKKNSFLLDVNLPHWEQDHWWSCMGRGNVWVISKFLFCRKIAFLVVTGQQILFKCSRRFTKKSTYAVQGMLSGSWSWQIALWVIGLGCAKPSKFQHRLWSRHGCCLSLAALQELQGSLTSAVQGLCCHQRLSLTALKSCSDLCGAVCSLCSKYVAFSSIHQIFFPMFMRWENF